MGLPMSHPIVVIVICDGHRPDFVSEETTPHMARLRQAGTWFADHRGIFPSATRASSASIATGCWIAWTEGQYGRIADRERP
jgi:predicted AlkP superfamily pyrophosphatase or phosphodiesterase